MKSLKLICFLLIATICSVCSKLNAQSFHYELTARAESGDVGCGVFATGFWTYHITYHLDKDGQLSNLHWNINKCELINVATGEKLRTHDTGNDNAGVLWDLMSNLNAYNADYGANIVYDQADGWLNSVLPENYPGVGRVISINFKVVGKGVIGTWKTQIFVELSPNGELTYNVLKGDLSFDCK